MARQKGKGKIGWRGQLFMVVGLIAAVIFSAVSTILVVGMIPTAVAAIVDRSSGRMRAVTVGAINFAGCAPFMIEVFKKGNSLEAAIGLIIQPQTIVIMYFAAGIGYLVDWAMTGIVSAIMVQKTRARLKEIQVQQKSLVERWGTEVTGTIPLDEFGFPRDVNAQKVEDAGAA